MRVSIFYIALIFGSIQMLVAHPVSSQSLDQIQVKTGLTNEDLRALFKKIEDQTNLRFAFNPNEVDAYKSLSFPEETRSIKATLDLVFANTPLHYRQSNNSVIVFTDEIEISEQPVMSSIWVQGTIRMANGEPLPGVSVMVKGTANGTTTNEKGFYILEVQQQDVLVFSFIGYKTVEETVINSNVINVTLEEDAKVLGEVVINAGYYTVRDKEKTGSISRVGAEVIARQPVTNPLLALQGRTPGVSIEQFSGVPGSGVKIRIRGTNSLNNGNSPYYLVDGIPFTSESMSDINASSAVYGNVKYGGGGSPFNLINPNDIESIEILRDADATSLYGSRGANGVILITTKKGKVGGTKVELSVRSGFSRVSSNLELLKTKDYVDMRLTALANSNQTPSQYDFDVNGTWDLDRYTDWQDVLTGNTANNTTVNASVSGGSENTQFLFSTGYDRQTTVFPGANLARRLSLHFSVNHASRNKKFSTQLSTSYSVNDSDMTGDITSNAFILAPNAPALHDENGELNWENNTFNNPLAQLRKRFKANAKTILNSLQLGYKIERDLNVSVKVGLNNMQNQELNIDPSDSRMPGTSTPASSKLDMGNASIVTFNMDPQMDWQKMFGKSKIAAVIGGQFQDQITERETNQYIGFASNDLIYDPNSAATKDLIYYTYLKYRYVAAFARVNYSWNERYFINLTGRRDGSSRFGPGRKFANFGAIGAAWIFTNEKFFKANPERSRNDERSRIVSFGKLRASFGASGNDQIGDYKYLDTYQSSNGSYLTVSGLVPTQLFNPNYGWESTRKGEVALELGFFQDGILFTTAYYNNRSSNQLIEYRLPGTAGLPTILKNFPAIVNNFGWEFELTTTNISNELLEWTTSFNVTLPKNELVAFPGLESSSYYRTYEIGKPLTVQRIFKYAGLDSETGIYQFEDMNGDGSITQEDQLYSVDLGQRFYGGLSNSLTLKGFQFDFNFQFVKQKRYSPGRSKPGIAFTNQPISVLEGVWTGPGDIDATKQPFNVLGQDYSEGFSRYIGSSAFIEDASFIRLKNVSLSYNFPKKLLKAVQCRIYAQAQNVLTITKYSGPDPESGSFLPPLRTIVLGAQLTL